MKTPDSKCTWFRRFIRNWWCSSSFICLSSTSFSSNQHRSSEIFSLCVPPPLWSNVVTICPNEQNLYYFHQSWFPPPSPVSKGMRLNGRCGFPFTLGRARCSTPDTSGKSVSRRISEWFVVWECHTEPVSMHRVVVSRNHFFFNFHTLRNNVWFSR